MTTLHDKILSLLRKRSMKPGELARKLKISRQALHRHLHTLLDQKRLQKQGTAPHTTYASLTHDTNDSRVRAWYELCRRQLLPTYIAQYGGFLGKYIRGRFHAARDENIRLDFLLDAAAVYSSNIEGNTLNLSNFLNSRMSPRKHRPKEAQEIEDLVSAYAFARGKDLSEKHALRAHGMLSRDFVARSRQGKYRQEPVGVFSERGLEYMAVEPVYVAQEMRELFGIIEELLEEKHLPAESFFWGSWIHLIIALIHPFSDGNGRTARLCEKWFLGSKLGERGFAVPSEECYWKMRPSYYRALKLGVNYWEADIGKALSFFTLLPEALRKHQ